jgi:hypothetical protein
MEKHPIYQQYIMVPFHWGHPFDYSGPPKIIPDRRLVWHLRGHDVFYYVCMHALEQNAREEDCSTPYFRFKNGEIPEEILDWMNRYARIWMAGAGWYRQYCVQKMDKGEK